MQEKQSAPLLGHEAKKEEKILQANLSLFVQCSFKFVFINMAKGVETKYFTGKENKQQGLSLKLLLLNSSEKENRTKIKKKKKSHMSIKNVSHRMVGFACGSHVFTAHMNFSRTCSEQNFWHNTSWKKMLS